MLSLIWGNTGAGEEDTIIFCFLLLCSLNSVSQIIDPQEQAKMGSKLSRANSRSPEFLNQGWMYF